MADIHSLKELNAMGRDLKLDDVIYFTIPKNELKYSVWGKHLTDIEGDDNAIIFNYLNLDMSDKYDLAEQCYGYKPVDNKHHLTNWPEYRLSDFSALERLIREIYKRLGDSSVEILDPSQFINNRFEI